eukprot:6075503-Amphidinium_carterae.1
MSSIAEFGKFEVLEGVITRSTGLQGSSALAGSSRGSARGTYCVPPQLHEEWGQAQVAAIHSLE